jgi:hypothetical protein
VYPNPFTDGFTVVVPSGGSVECVLQDMPGRVYAVRVRSESGGGIFVDPLEDLAPGVYVLTVISGGNPEKFRLVKN